MISEKELRDMYWVQGMSQPEIAKEIGVSKCTVHRWMSRYVIKLRNVLKPSKKELEQMYWNEEMSMISISKEINVSLNSIKKWMCEYDIKARTKSESHLISVSKPSKKELELMYWNSEMSQNMIAKEIGVTSCCVNVWMREYGIKPRSISESLIGRFTGKNNPSWNGGTSFEPYCSKFNNTFKEAVRERDDYTCQLCEHEQKLGGQKLDVHHIHYDKENCYPDVVALCHSCNAKVNSNRDEWEKYFEEQLMERGLLNWSIETEVS